MGRPRVVVEFETCSRDLPHGGVFVPGLKLAELAECELVVRIPGRELALVARAVMVTPAGCGLELVGFGAEIRTKLADLATAALTATARKSTPPGIPTSRPPPPPPPTASASSPRIPTPATLTKPAPPLPVPRPTSTSTPPPPPPPRSRPTTPPPAPPPPPRASEDDEPEMTIERPEDDEPEMTIEPGDELSGKRDTRLQTAPMIAVPTVDEPDEPELTTKPAAALDNADDDDANFARLFDDKPAATAPAKEEPNFAEVADEPPQDDGPTVTANPEELDDEPAMITEHRQEDTAITRLPHRHEDTAVTRHEATAVTRHEATAITPAPTGPDPDGGDGDSDDEERHEATAITTRPLGPDEHPLDPDEPTIMPSTFEPMALETGYRPPSRALRPEPSIPVSQWETNRWGHVDLDDNMPRTEIRDDKAALSLDAEPPDELLELTDAPAAAAAAAAAKPAPAGAGDASPAAGAKPADAKPAAEPADAAGAAEAGEAADDDGLAGATEEERKFAKNVHERLRGLNLVQQIKLAHGGETHERIVLERMYGKTVWEALLRNPRITGPEVARIARMGQLPRPLIEIIVGNGGWLQIPEVRRALLSNPRLGTDQILRVLRLLPKQELKLAGVQTSYPSVVRDAARKLVKEMTR